MPFKSCLVKKQMLNNLTRHCTFKNMLNSKLSKRIGPLLWCPVPECIYAQHSDDKKDAPPLSSRSLGVVMQFCGRESAWNQCYPGKFLWQQDLSESVFRCIDGLKNALKLICLCSSCSCKYYVLGCYGALGGLAILCSWNLRKTKFYLLLVSF